MSKKNCWEIMQCGFGPGQKKALKYGVCSAAVEAKLDGVNHGENGGRSCWTVQGTMCGNKRDIGSAKGALCKGCRVYRQVQVEEAEEFCDASEILGTWDKKRLLQERIRFTILLPLIVALILIFAASIGSVMLRQHYDLQNIAKNNLALSRNQFEMELATVAMNLDDLVTFVMQDNLVQRAWKSEDSDAVLAATSQAITLFSAGRTISNVTYYNRDRSPIVALEANYLNGQRSMAEEGILGAAQSSLESAKGLALTVDGNLSFVMVQPWFIDKELTGFIEVSLAINDIIPRIKNRLDTVELLIVLDKKHLDRERWQQLRGMRGMDHKWTWEQFPGFVICCSTLEKLPDNLADLLAADHDMHNDLVEGLVIHERHYQGMAGQLVDASGGDLGDILVLTDVGHRLHSMQKLLSVILGTGSLIGTALFGFFYLFVGRVQSRIIRANDILMDEVAERRSAEEGQRIAREQAERASRAKSDFLANMSHEIRTPMTGAIGMINLTLDTDLTSKQREYLTMAKSASKNLMTLINNILDFSKIEAGKLIIDKTVFRLRDVVDSVIDTMIFEAQAKGVGLKASFEGTLPETFAGDPERLRQVMLNLVGNALKFTRSGSVQLVCGQWEGNQHTGVTAAAFVLHVAVVDTGIGISQVKQASIFEAFQQADGSTTRRFGGTGLGLSICSSLLKMMDGRIWVESEAGRGSTFHFIVPLDLQDNRKHAEEPESSIRRMDRNQLIGLKGLVVEDEQIIREIAVHVLESAGCEVLSVVHGREALNLLERERFDFVVMDMRMPIMDGFETCRHIREQERESGAHLPIISVTANAFKEDRIACLESGADNYLPKPFESEKLIGIILETLGGQRKKKSLLPAAADHDGQLAARKVFASKIFDAGAACANAGGDLQAVPAVVQRFLDEANALSVELRQALAAGEAAAKEGRVHTMKNLANQAGACRTADLFFKMTIRLQRKQFDKALEELDEVDSSLQELAAVLAEVQREKG